MIHDRRLVIFAKAPVAGQVNTRLVPDIGVEAATALQQELIELRARQFGDADGYDVQLACAPDTADAVFRSVEQDTSISLVQQSGDDLGQRMSKAFELAFDTCDKVVLIGTDAPVVDDTVVREAFIMLDESDVVLQPAEDGGYVLIGMNAYHPVIFHGVPWGSDRVLVKTRSNIVAAGLTWSELPTAWDIDTQLDYERYRGLTRGR